MLRNFPFNLDSVESPNHHKTSINDCLLIGLDRLMAVFWLADLFVVSGLRVPERAGTSQACAFADYHRELKSGTRLVVFVFPLLGVGWFMRTHF